MDQIRIIVGTGISIVLAFAGTSAFAECAERIDALDQRVDSSPPDARVTTIFGQVRERAVDLCKAGQDAAALQTVQMLENLLQAPEAASAAESEESSAPSLNDTDFTRAVQSFDHDSPNPWDRLTSVQICDWLTADEVEEALGLAVELKFSRSDWLCNYRFMMPNGYSATAFTLFVEPHEDPSHPRAAESRLSRSGQYERFDPGARLLRSYNNEFAPTIYVFPEDGITIWELSFLEDSPEKDVMFGPAPQPPNLGKAFLTLLIDKHGARFESGP